MSHHKRHLQILPKLSVAKGRNTDHTSMRFFSLVLFSLFLLTFYYGAFKSYTKVKEDINPSVPIIQLQEDHLLRKPISSIQLFPPPHYFKANPVHHTIPSINISIASLLKVRVLLNNITTML